MLHLTGNCINQNVTTSMCKKRRNVKFKGKFTGSTKPVKSAAMYNLNFKGTQLSISRMIVTCN
jgi:hypothetical protein